MRSLPRRSARAALPISLCAVLGACSATTTPSVNIPAPSAAPVTTAPATRPAGPIVLFVVEGDVLAPVVEGIENQTMTSAVSRWVLALPLPGGEDDILGTWGCRMF